MSFNVRNAVREDVEAILALMPRLASFDLPEARNPVHLWESDAAMLKRWRDGEAAECFVHVAVDGAEKVLGFTLTSLRPELLSHEPSAHLEALAVGEGAEGQGVGRALLAAVEDEAKIHGAQTITLHVFARNTRARSLYEGAGYDGELLRYIKGLVE